MRDLEKKYITIENYIMQMRPMFIKSALFSDGTADYRYPVEPKAGEDVKIRFRTAAGNVEFVYLCIDDRQIEMEVAESTKEFDYYESVIQMEDKEMNYYFRIESGLLECYYDRVGITRTVRPQYSFTLVPGFSTPDWAKGAVMYQIFTDRFYNGDKTNDVVNNEYYYIKKPVKKVDDWYKTPDTFDVADFYGGDLAGVMQKLDYLQNLGVEALYFNPLFVSASSHKYDTQDYDYIDPHFGVIFDDDDEPLPAGSTDNREAAIYRKRVTSRKNLEASNRLFISLVQEAHRRGIKVIVDGVFNHCGSFNKWLDRERIYEGTEGFEEGAYLSKESPYHDYFSFSDEDQFPYNDTYNGWWGHNTLPKLNYENSKALEEYIINVGKKWVSPPFNCDGWRLDVAADLGFSQEYNHKFWKKFRAAVKEANPEALILAEHYGEPDSWLKGDEWDTVMNYDAFMEPITWFLTGMEKHSDSYRDYMLGNVDVFQDSMNHSMASFSTSSLQCAMNELSNHDHSRFLTRTNHKVGRLADLGAAAASEDVNKGVLKEAVVFQMTWPGAPTIYYGDEAGLCGFTDPDNRRTYPWGREDRELLHFHRAIIAIHKNNPALRTGSVKFLNGEKNVLCFARFNRDQQFIIIINNDSYQRSLDLSVWTGGIPRDSKLTQVMYTTESSFSINPVTYQVQGGHLKISLPRYSSVVLRHDN